MIRSFRPRGLKRLFEHGDGRRIRADQRARVTDVLLHLDHAGAVTELDLPGFRLHPLRGDLEGHWSIAISGNWRIIFRFEEGDAFAVDLVDYH